VRNHLHAVRACCHPLTLHAPQAKRTKRKFAADENTELSGAYIRQRLEADGPDDVTRTSAAEATVELAFDRPVRVSAVLSIVCACSCPPIFRASSARDKLLTLQTAVQLSLIDDSIEAAFLAPNTAVRPMI
jgi:hypothetical protein